MPRELMLASMSSREYNDWLALASFEPIGDRRGDLQAAIIASTIANVHRDEKKKDDPFQFKDFMPQFIKEIVEDKPWQALLKAAESAFGRSE